MLAAAAPTDTTPANSRRVNIVTSHLPVFFFADRGSYRYHFLRRGSIGHDARYKKLVQRASGREQCAASSAFAGSPSA
jgi:hypothetical protein